MAGTTDVLVIGGGVFGLAAALRCARAGLRVILCEAGAVGATGGGAASAGLVGALTAHRPGKWRPFKAFQLDALLGLPDWMAALGRDTDLNPGYRPGGRLTPLVDAGQRARAAAQVAEAAAHWRGAGALEVLDAVPGDQAGWLDPAACPFGVLHDTLAAQVEPRRYLAALTAAVRARVELREGWACRAVDPETAAASFDQGAVAAGHVVLAAGSGAFALIEGFSGRTLGRGVKGQAALLAADPGLPAQPLIQADGVFVIHHGGGHVAVGSTSEARWDGLACDAQLDAVIARARALCPALAGAEVVERWAGIRPRTNLTAPMAGPLPGARRVIAAAGGYKIGLAIAHAVAAIVRDAILGRRGASVPAELDPAHHFCVSEAPPPRLSGDGSAC